MRDILYKSYKCAYWRWLLKIEGKDRQVFRCEMCVNSIRDLSCNVHSIIYIFMWTIGAITCNKCSYKEANRGYNSNGYCGYIF